MGQKALLDGKREHGVFKFKCHGLPAVGSDSCWNQQRSRESIIFKGLIRLRTATIAKLKSYKGASHTWEGWSRHAVVCYVHRKESGCI